MVHKKIEEIKLFLKKNFLVVALFVLSTALFVYQHYTNLSWDFSAYVLNAKYLFYHGAYFESLRTPVAPVLLAVFLIFGVIGEHLYIILVSALFMYANIKLSDAVFKRWALEEKIGKEFCRVVLYTFSLSFFTLIYATAAGTELLSLAFFELFLAMMLTGRVSGWYLGLAFLSMYSFILYLPLLLVNRKIKKIGYNILGFAVVTAPWLIFNYAHFGNPFASIIDAYANNILFRQYLMQAFDYKQILTVMGWFLPFAAIGAVLAIFSLFAAKKEWFSRNKPVIFFSVLAFLVLWDYNNIPLKQIRYLFNLTLPVAFFCSFGVIALCSRVKMLISRKNLVIFILIALFILNLFSAYAYINGAGNYDDKFYSAGSDIKKLGIENCEILSPQWVLITYFTENVYALGGNNIKSSLDNNKIVLIFKNEVTMDDEFTLGQLDIYKRLYETKDYFFLIGEKFAIENCSKKYVFDGPYVTNHCKLIAEKFEGLGLDSLAFKSCSLVSKPGA